MGEAKITITVSPAVIDQMRTAIQEVTRSNWPLISSVITPSVTASVAGMSVDPILMRQLTAQATAEAKRVLMGALGNICPVCHTALPGDKVVCGCGYNLQGGTP